MDFHEILGMSTGLETWNSR